MNIVDSAMLRAAISKFRFLRSKAELSHSPPFPSDNLFVINRRSLFSASRSPPNGPRYGQSWQTRKRLSTESAENSLSSSQADDILITDNCIRRMKELQKEEGLEGEKILRLCVEGGGCSGFQYSFTLDDKPNKDDRVFEKEGIKLVVDDISYGFVKGATVDYVEELIRSAFMVTINPNAGGGCGCGSSFTVK